MIESETHLFNGGLDQDTDKRLIGADKITNANDVDYMSFDGGKTFSLQPLPSSNIAYTILDVTRQAQVDRLFYGGNVVYSFQIFIQGGAVLNIAVNPGTAVYADLITAFQAALLTLYGSTYTVTFSGSTQDDFYTLSLSLSTGVTINYAIKYSVGGVITQTYTIQQGIEATRLFPTASETIQNVDVIFSIGLDANCQEIGLATEVSGVWTYTRVLRTNELGWLLTDVFDIRVENQANEYYGIYFTNGNTKPAVIYITKNYTTDCGIRWSTMAYGLATIGVYTLNNIGNQAALQLVNNMLRVQYSDQLQGGGGLLSGGYRYAIRCGLQGTGNTTEWCVLSNLIPVFKTSINSPSAWVRIQGDKAGESTAKANALQVYGAMSAVFNFVELAAVYYSGTAEAATSAYIVKRQDITTDNFTITHTGLETGTIALDIASLPAVQELITKSTSIEIKKNRLNLADNTIAVSDETFVSLSLINEANIDTDIDVEELDTVGKLNSIAPGFIVYADSPVFNPFSGFYSAGFFNFNQVLLNIGGQFSTPSLDPANRFTAIAGYTKATLSGIFKIKADTDVPSSITIHVQKQIFGGGIVSLAISPAIPISTKEVIINIGSVLGGTSEGIVFSASSGDYISVLYEFNTQELNKKAIASNDSYIEWGNGDIATQIDFDNTRVGEYQLPSNVALKTGYTIYENYPFYAKYHMDSGYITEGYYMGTVTFNPPSGKHLTDYSASNNLKAYAYKLILNNIPAGQLRALGAKGISIWRGVCNPTILGTGICLQSDNVYNDNIVSGFYASIPGFNNQFHAIVPNSDAKRNFGVFISADTRVSQPSFNDGDKIISFGNPFVLMSSGLARQVVPDEQGMPTNTGGTYAEYMGYTADSDMIYTVEDSQYVKFKETGTAMGTQKYKPYLDAGDQGESSAEGIAYVTTAPINAVSGNDNGVKLAQYQRALIQQYDPKSISIVPTGTFIEINGDTPTTLNGIEVFGGDTYTQKSIVKLCYGIKRLADQSIYSYSFISYYGQNKVNTELFYCDKSQDENSWNLMGTQDINTYLFPTVVSISNPEEQFNYDIGYFAPNIINKETPYNPDLQVNKRFGSRIWYSEQKPTGSVYDFYRTILPLNFTDLDNKFGNIVAIFDIYDIMLAIQPNAVNSLPYQTDVALSAADKTSVYVGNGGVYAQRGHVVSAYGSGIKTATVRGKNVNGNYDAYWYSDLFHKMMRYGAGDGVKIISDLNNMRSWFLNNTAHISANYDMVLGYDVNRQSLMITSRAINKTIPQWDASISYVIGDQVYYNEVVGGIQHTNTFSNVPNIYTATVNNLNAPPYLSNDWNFEPTTDNTLYNYCTLIFNEKFDIFSTFSTILPARYFPYLGTILAPRPAIPFNDVYDIFVGPTYLNYFAGQGGQFIVEVTTSKGPFEPKRAISTALLVGQDHNAAFNPDLEIYNEYQDTTVTGAQMELRRGNLVSSVRNDQSDRPLISQWNSYRITTANFIRILGVITSFYRKKRDPAK